MTRRLLASFLLLAVFVMGVVALPLGITYTRRAEDRLLTDVERDARVLGTLVEPSVAAGDPAGVAGPARAYATQTGGRVVVVDAAGVSLADTDRPGADRRDFSTRPEFVTALGGRQAAGIRASDTLGAELAYVAAPITTARGVEGAVRISFPTEELREQVRGYWARLALLMALVLGLAAAMGWLMARWALGPVAALQSGARQLASGDLSGRATVDRGPPELRDLARTFNEMAARLETLVESQRAFVADASHQLRTPLTALRLRLDSLEAEVRAGDHDAAASEVDAVGAEVDRLGRLVEGLLALARSEGGRAASVTVDAARVADAAVARWEALAAEHDVALVRSGVPAAPVRVVDGALEQVLDNLVDNALEAVPGGTEVAIGVTVAADAVRLTVRDHGPGLSDDDLARATDRFWRGPTSAPSGTGLGLAVVHQLVTAGGGTLTLRRPDDGTGLEVQVDLVPAHG